MSFGMQIALKYFYKFLCVSFFRSLSLLWLNLFAIGHLEAKANELPVSLSSHNLLEMQTVTATAAPSILMNMFSFSHSIPFYLCAYSMRVRDSTNQIELSIKINPLANEVICYRFLNDWPFFSSPSHNHINFATFCNWNHKNLGQNMKEQKKNNKHSSEPTHMIELWQ